MGLAFASCAARSRIRCGTSRESGMVPPYGYNSRKNTFLPPYSHAVLTSIEYTGDAAFVDTLVRVRYAFEFTQAHLCSGRTDHTSAWLKKSSRPVRKISPSGTTSWF